MYYFIMYTIFMVVSFVSLSIKPTMSKLNNVAFTGNPKWLTYSIVIIQLILFYFMGKRRMNENEIHKAFVDSEVEESSDDESVDLSNTMTGVLSLQEVDIRKNKSGVSWKHWLFLFFVYLSSSFYTSYLNGVAYYISEILTIILALSIVKPLIVESINGFKQNTLKRNALIVIQSVFIIYMFNIFYAVLLESVLGVTGEPSNQNLIELMLKQDPFKMFLEITFSAAIMEELVFRGIGFRTLIHKNRLLAYALTFTMFGVPHLMAGFLQGSGFSEFLFLPIYGMMGVFMARSYEKSNSIFIPMAVHFINNFISFLLII